MPDRQGRAVTRPGAVTFCRKTMTCVKRICLIAAAGVLLVSPGSGQAQMVVKLGSATELQREYAAYRQYVKQASPQNTARLQGEPLLTDDEQLALLSYTFAGGDPRRPTNSLQAYYESKGGQATAAVLDRVFRRYSFQVILFYDLF